MSAIRNRLLAMRAEIDSMLQDLPAEAPANQQTATPTWMKLPEFAAYRNMSVGTVRSRLDEGMPASGTGHARRINVPLADEWLAKRP